jgi:sphingosine kinase
MTTFVRQGKLIYGSHQQHVTVSLSESTLNVSTVDHSKNRTVPLQEIFGVHILSSPSTTEDVQSCTFGVYLLELQSEKLQRLTFTAPTHSEALAWVNDILKTVFKVDDASVIDSSKRRVLLLLNPNSGTKTGRKIFQKVIKPMWDKAHLQYTVVETERSLHALQMCSDAAEVDLAHYTDIVAMGGDGSLYEAINGCMSQIISRPDRDVKPSDIRFGVIPCGTSNGLAAAIGCSKKDGARPSAARAALIIARGFSEPFDLLSVFQKDERRFFFLSITWGLIADADLGTENMRWLGSLRNLVGALKGIMKQKYLHGQLKYVENASNTKSKSEQEIPDKVGPFSGTRPDSTDASFSTRDTKAFPACDNLLKYFPEDFKRIAPSYYEEQLKYTTQDSTIDDDQQQVKTIEDKIFAFLACNVSHIAHDAKIAPKACVSDGSIDLIVLRDKSMSRLGMTKLFLGVEDGSYFHHPSVEFTKVSSFVLNPCEEGSYIAIDGELGHYDSAIVDMHKGLLNLMTL